MRRIFVIGLLVVSSLLLFAAAKNTHQFTLPSTVKVGDVQLPEGPCVVTWTEASGSQVQLTIKAADKTVTVPARFVEDKQDHVVVSTFVADGVTYLKELQTKKARFIIKDSPTAQ